MSKQILAFVGKFTILSVISRGRGVLGEEMERIMRNLVLAAFVVLNLGFGVAHAASYHTSPQQGNDFNYVQGGGG
jgi:hypothetical protein